MLLIVLSINYAYGQTVRISGQVLDEQSNKPLAFVTIGIEGTNNGFSTDIDGRFDASVETQHTTLIFSYIGYRKRKVYIDELIENRIVLLNQTGIDINEVKVVPGINPADLIMERVINNRKVNNPEEATEFSYDSYNKLVFTVNPDSVSKEIELQKDSVNKDSSLLDVADYISKQHLL